MSTTIHEALVQFSSSLPDWQQDLFRRVVVHQGATTEDIEVAASACLRQTGLHAHAPAEPVSLVPLTTQHLPTGAGNVSACVRLEALCDLDGVNALLPGETLRFEGQGLNVVFGQNGAGKSGYARVLKHLCRARGASPVLPNAFSEGGAPRGTVRFSVGAERKSFTGCLDGSAEAPAVLGQVSVYDRAAGLLSLRDKHAVELLPAGLDLLDAFRQALDATRDRLRTLQGQDEPPTLPSVPDSHPAAALLAAALEAPEEGLEELLHYSEDDERKRTQLENDLAGGARRAEELEGRAQRLDSLAGELEDLARALTPKLDERVRQIRAALDTAATAVQLLREQDAEAHLPGTLTEAWRQLWESARHFVDTELPGEHAHPHVHAGARCPLCQQEIRVTARARLQAFEAFVQSETSTRHEEAKTALEKGRNHLQGMQPSALLERATRTEEQALDPDLPDTIDAALRSAEQRRDTLLALLDGRSTDTPAPLLSLPTGRLRELVASDREQAKRLTDPAVRQKLEAELPGLQARARLADHHHTIQAVRAHRERQSAWRAAQGACRTNRVSNLAKKLSATHVTQTLAEAFNAELVGLGADRLNVSLESGGARKGQPLQRLVLRDAQRDDVVLPSILSEGEQRTVALAAFFAELAAERSGSAIVFDDPVSSLDQRWRTAVARRLAQEATRRQVVVFTHDVVFLLRLQQEAKTHSAQWRAVELLRRAGRPGACAPGLPWDLMPLKSRYNVLKQELKGLRKTERTLDERQYRERVDTFLVRLRKTWERAVEECLFYQSVQRFVPDIQTKRLAKVDIRPEDYPTIEAGMNFGNPAAHDQAGCMEWQPPSSVSLAAELNRLADWVQALRDRRTKCDLPVLKRVTIRPASGDLSTD